MEARVGFSPNVPKHSQAKAMPMIRHDVDSLLRLKLGVNSSLRF